MMIVVAVAVIICIIIKLYFYLLCHFSNYQKNHSWTNKVTEDWNIGVFTCCPWPILAVSVSLSSRQSGTWSAEGPCRSDSPAERCFLWTHAHPGDSPESLFGLMGETVVFEKETKNITKQQSNGRFCECVTLTEDFQVSSDGDVSVFDKAGVGSRVIVTDVGQLQCPVGQQGDARVRQQRNHVITLPTENTHTNVRGSKNRPGVLDPL